MTAYGICLSCSEVRGLTGAGLLRRHQYGGVCPGSGELPEGPAEAPVQVPRRAIPAPGGPTHGKPCELVDCRVPSIGWRFFRSPREWLPVCGVHMRDQVDPRRIFNDECTA